MRPPYWAYNVAESQIFLSIFHLSERTAQDYVWFLSKHQDQVLEGFPSALGILADLVLQSGVKIQMRVLFTDGEPLYPFLRAKIEKAFQAQTYDLYGNTEFSGLMHECEHHRMHLIPDYSFLEILDSNNQPVGPGAEGFLVWTGFINSTMPLIRYRIGDRGRWETCSLCPCGRNFPLVVPTITRESDLLRVPDGRIFSPRALNQLLKTSSSFRFCQFIQAEPRVVVIRAVASDRDAEADLAVIRGKLQNIVGPEVQVLSELTKEPVVRAGGKIPLIVQQAYANGGQVPSVN
jgi:phenylacetate-CoA ligase